MPSTDSKLRFPAWLVALFLVILGAKFWVIQTQATAIPYWDQWDEAKLLFKPWLEGHLTWSTLFAPHNEHRILFTRLLDLFVVWLNGQWDPVLQMVVNAFIYAGYACGLAYCLWRVAERKSDGLACCFLLVPFFTFPFAMDNTIHGFQSSMYFLGISAVATIIGLGFGTPGSKRWSFGLIAALVSLFTMASGLLAALTVIGLLIFRMLKEKRMARDRIVTIGCGLAVFGFGLLLNIGVKTGGPFQAKSIPAFVGAFISNLAWPFEDQPAMAAFVCLPLVLTAIVYFQPGFKATTAAEFFLALGLWDVLQSAALAYGRVHIGNSSRYLDTLCTIPIASLGSLLIIWPNADRRWVSQWMMRLFTVIWTAVVFAEMGWISWLTIADRGTVDGHLPWTKQMGIVQEENVRAFVATDDSRYLLNRRPWHVPYWDGGRLVELLRDPKLMAILPPACRAPLKVESVGDVNASFVPDGCPSERPKREFARVWGSYTTNGAAATGHFLSRRIFATLPFLKIQLCCGPDTNGIKIQLVEQPTSRKIELSPRVIGRWHTITVPAPQSPFRLEITDQSHDSWVAAGEIKELGLLSNAASWLLNHAVALLLIGLSLFVLLSGSRVFCRRNVLCAEGLVELAILLLALAAVICVWPRRNFDSAEFTRELHQKWGRYFESNGDLRSAELHFRESLWLNPDDPDTFTNLAGIILRDPGLKKEKARAEAVSNYEAALRLKPDSPEIKNQLRAPGVQRVQ